MSQHDPIKVGLVSFGAASRVFHAPLISAVEGLELAAVVERRGHQAAEIYRDIATYTSLEAMLADQSLELVVVATPNATHEPLARKILEASRHVVVDKPTGIAPVEIFNLITLATEKDRLLVPFHNRRWDSDFRTIQQLIVEGKLGSVNYFESTFDRWRPHPRLAMWKENGDPGGGNLLDIGTHLVDQALYLFGLPESVNAEVASERENAVTDDAFTIRLRYPDQRVTLSSNCLAAIPRPRFSIRGTEGNFEKHHLDPQEARLKESATGSETPDSPWGEEPPASWGTLAIATEGNEYTTSRIESLPGDYRFFYQGVRDAIRGLSAPPVSGQDALRTAQILEWARQSSDQRREISCNWC